MRGMKVPISLGAALGAATLGLLAIVAAPAAQAATYAKVTGHVAFSNEANQAGYWGKDCFKVSPGGSSYVLPAGVYTQVIVKAGALNVGANANTVFGEPPKAGQTVWADTNGDGVYNPGGQNGDKGISHVIVCKGKETSQSPTPTPTTTSPTPTPTTTSATPTPTVTGGTQTSTPTPPVSGGTTPPTPTPTTTSATPTITGGTSTPTSTATPPPELADTGFASNGWMAGMAILLLAVGSAAYMATRPTPRH